MLRTRPRVIPRTRLLIAVRAAESTRSTLALTEQAAASGADMVVVITPQLLQIRMDGAALRRHFLQVAERSPVPVHHLQHAA